MIIIAIIQHLIHITIALLAYYLAKSINSPSN